MDVKRALGMKHPKKIKLENNPGLIEDNSQEYLKILQLVEGNVCLMKLKVKVFKPIAANVTFIEEKMINLCIYHRNKI